MDDACLPCNNWLLISFCSSLFFAAKVCGILWNFAYKYISNDRSVYVQYTMILRHCCVSSFVPFSK